MGGLLVSAVAFPYAHGQLELGLDLQVLHDLDMDLHSNSLYLL